MSNSKFINNESLPKGNRTSLCLPGIADKEEFLLATKESVALHHPWVEAPSDEERYQQYIQKINFESHIALFIRQIDDNKLIGVVNINEIVKGVFQSGYLGFYAFKNFNGRSDGVF